MKFTKTIEINNNIAFLVEVLAESSLHGRSKPNKNSDVLSLCSDFTSISSNLESINELNVNLNKDNIKLSIRYTNGLGDMLYFDKINIAQIGYGKPVLILKNTFISIKENTNALSIENDSNGKQKRLSVYDCLDDKNFELVLDWLLQNGLVIALDDMKNNSQNVQNHFDIFSEYPNLTIFKHSLSDDSLNHYQSALFSPKNWLVSNKEKNPLLPFYFEKKEHFNYLKMLDKDVVDYLISNNRTMHKDGYSLNSVPLFVSLMCYLPNQELIQKYRNGFNQQNNIESNLTNLTICHLYDVFLSLFLNTGKSSIFDYDLFIQLFDKKNKLNTLFYLFLSDFLSTIENDALYQETKELDFDLIQYKKEIYQKILLVCYDANLIKDKLGQTTHDCITFFQNIESKKNSNIQSLLKYVLDYEEYLNYRLDIAFMEHRIVKNMNEKTIGLIFDKPFLFQNHIFVPLSNSYDFYMESEFMKNCVKSKEHMAYIYNYMTNYNQSLFFHIVDINNLDNHWLKEKINIASEATKAKLQQVTAEQAETILEKNSLIDFSIIDTSLYEVYQNTKSSRQSILRQINLHTKENILYDKKVINGCFKVCESKLQCNKLLQDEQHQLIQSFISELNNMNKTQPFDLFLSNM